MGWRTVILSKEAKLSLRMEHLIISGESVHRILLEEISIVLIENPNIILTGHIINALSAYKIVTIVCDTRMKPATVLHSVYGHHRQSKNIWKQVEWQDDHKGNLWRVITQQKILNQEKLLAFLKKDGVEELQKFRNEVELYDSSNREGHAAKVYFNRLFESDFTRSLDEPRNWALNYGYTVLHSLIARHIISRGYLTEVGIFHSNEFNQMNLASDLIEVFRPIVDFIVHEKIQDSFGKEEKRIVLKMLEYKITIKNAQQYLQTCVQIYIDNCIQYLNEGDASKLTFPVIDYQKMR